MSRRPRDAGSDLGTRPPSRQPAWHRDDVAPDRPRTRLAAGRMPRPVLAGEVVDAFPRDGRGAEPGGAGR